MITHLYQSNTFFSFLFFPYWLCEASRKTKSKEKHFRPPQSGYGRNEERRPQGTKLRLIHTEFTVFDPKSEAPVLLQLSSQLVSFRTWTSSSKQSVTRTSAWPAVAGTPLRWASHFFFFIFLFFFQSFACVYSFVPSSHRQLHTLLSFLLQRFLDVVLTEQSKKTCFTYTSTNQKYAGAEPTAHRQTDRQQTAANWLLRPVFYKNILVFYWSRSDKNTQYSVLPGVMWSDQVDIIGCVVIHVWTFISAHVKWIIRIIDNMTWRSSVTAGSLLVLLCRNRSGLWALLSCSAPLCGGWWWSRQKGFYQVRQ